MTWQTNPCWHWILVHLKLTSLASIVCKLRILKIKYKILIFINFINVGTVFKSVDILTKHPPVCCGHYSRKNTWRKYTMILSSSLEMSASVKDWNPVSIKYFEVKLSNSIFIVTRFTLNARNVSKLIKLVIAIYWSEC